MFAGESASTLSTVLYSVAYVIVSFQFISYEAAMLPFLTDQIIGAASDDLSAVIRWYVWVQCLGACLSNFFTCFSTMEQKNMKEMSTFERQLYYTCK